MLSELHAGLYARYLEERQGEQRCPFCKSTDFTAVTTDIEDHYRCHECGLNFDDLEQETFEEWAERNDINLEEL